MSSGFASQPSESLSGCGGFGDSSFGGGGAFAAGGSAGWEDTAAGRWGAEVLTSGTGAGTEGSAGEARVRRQSSAVSRRSPERSSREDASCTASSPRRRTPVSAEADRRARASSEKPPLMRLAPFLGATLPSRISR